MSRYSISILQRAMEEAQTLGREADVEDFQRAIRIIDSERLIVINSKTASTIIRHQIESLEDDDKYSATIFKRMKIPGIAFYLANSFDGYLASATLRQILSKPGVLRSSVYAGNIASRALAKSDEFERVWVGLYRLKKSGN